MRLRCARLSGDATATFPAAVQIIGAKYAKITGLDLSIMDQLNLVEHNRKCIFSRSSLVSSPNLNA
jgi:hypothetical protein